MANIKTNIQANIQDPYKIFQMNREKLIELIYRIQTVFRKLNIESWDRSLNILHDKVKSEHFKIMVLGNFNAGKSTFINAMLGKEVLPTSIIPCTAVITEIKWGDEKRAILYFREPLPDKLPEIHKPTMDHIQKAGSKNVPPIEIPFEELNDYLTISDPAKVEKESIIETPYRKIELFWPFKLCENGIEIIDSPGLNDDEIRTKITTDYLPTTDAVLFILNCNVLAGHYEMEVIDKHIRGAGYEYIFFICNHFDTIRSKERDRLISYGQNKLKDNTRLGTEGIFFISAIDALEGRCNNDNSMIEKSGILKLEEYLTRFLTNEIGKIKLLQPSQELIHAIKEVRINIIPGQRKMLEENIDYIEKIYQQNDIQLKDAERYKGQIIEKINYHRIELKKKVKDITEKKLIELAEKIPQLVENLKVETKIKIITFKRQEQAEMLVKEVVSKTKDQIDQQLLGWRKEILIPLIDEKFEKMLGDIKGSVDNFYAKIDQINADFSGITGETTELGRDISGTERFIASLGGLLVGSIFSGAHGAMLGYKGLVASIATQIGIAVVAIGILGITNPFTILGALLGGSMLTGWLKKELLVDKAKIEIGKEIQIKFRNDIYHNADKLAENVYQQTNIFVKATESHLGQEINVIYEKVEAVLKDKKAGDEQVKIKKTLLNELEKEVNSVDAELQDLIFAVSKIRGMVPSHISSQ